MVELETVGHISIHGAASIHRVFDGVQTYWHGYIAKLSVSYK